MKIIKVKKFNQYDWDAKYNEFEKWQKDNPKIKIIKTEPVARQVHVEVELVVIYEEEEVSK